MNKIFSTLLVGIAVLAAFVVLTAVQAAAPKPPPLQPANQPEIFDFTGQVNDPDSPGNDGLNPAIGQSYENEADSAAEDPDDETVSAESDTDLSTSKIDSFSIVMTVLIIAISAAAGIYFWYKRRGNLS
jgi:hypothetical protein